MLLTKCLGIRYNCTGAASTEEAIELLALNTFNLLITDIVLPGASGFQLSQHISDTHPETVIVAMTGMADAKYTNEATRLGVYSLLRKPFDLPELFLLVDRAINYQALITSSSPYKQSPAIYANGDMEKSHQ